MNCFYNVELALTAIGTSLKE